MSFFEKLKKGMGVEIPEPVSKKIKSGPKKEPIEPKKEPLDSKKEPIEPKIKKNEEESFALKDLGGQEGQLAVDVYQTDGEIIIKSTIAGVKPEELDISIEDDLILIKGSREKPSEKSEINYFYQECHWGPFSRQIILPEETDPSRAEATMKEGILSIKIPKIERKKKRKIEIKN